MSKHILVCLPISAEQRTRIEAVQGFAYRFTTPDTATVEDALWADAVLGNLPVPLIRQKVAAVVWSLLPSRGGPEKPGKREEQL